MRLIHEFANQARSPRRRGAAIVFTAMTMVVLIGFAALTIDVGYMYSVRIDLQNAADAAALTAASAYATDYGVALRSDKSEGDVQKVRKLAIERAKSLSELNASIGTGATNFQNKDITLGWIEIDSETEPLDTDVDSHLFNAVRVLARRDGKSPNGAVELFFARIFGYAETDVTASAIAAFEDRVARVIAPPLIPFTLHEDYFKEQMEDGSDNYEYDTDSETVSKGKDHIKEVHLFPYSTSSGNYGTLNIGPSSSGTPDIAYQTANNIPADHLEATFGSADFQFIDDNGDPATYPVNGNSGLKASLDDEIQSRIGDIVAIFIHDSVSGKGSNTMYNITGIRFVRVMAVNLSSNPKYFHVQPIVYENESVIVSPNGVSTDGLIGQVVLAR